MMPLIWVNVIVFLLQWVTKHQLTVFLELTPDGIRGYEVWRLGTYMFAHGNPAHIFMNMWGLYMFGKPLEDRLGGTRFLNLYLLSGFIGGGTWLLFNWSATGPFGGAVIGASGAVFGVMMAVAMLYPRERVVVLVPLLALCFLSLLPGIPENVIWIGFVVCLAFSAKMPQVPMKLRTLVLIYAVMEIVCELAQLQGGVAHLAHLGGMLGGFIYIRRAFGHSRGSLWDSLQAWRHRRRMERAHRAEFEPGNGVPPRLDGDGPEPVNFRADVDRILDKIGAQGIASLTAEERKILEAARERFKKG